MHQSHNIPWNLITSNFEFRKNDRRFTPPRSGLLSKDNPNATQELKHFIRKFIHAIQTFSDTERAKYPDENSMIGHLLPTEGNLFSDELKKKYPSFLDDQNQRIEYWIWRAEAGLSSSGQWRIGEVLRYGWADEDLAYVVEILLYENEMSTLIMMAHHPKIPLASLHVLGAQYYNGFSGVKQSALRAYVFFNSAEATDILANGEYTHSDAYKSLLGGGDVIIDQASHQHFLQSFGLCDESGRFKAYSTHDPDWTRGVYVHTDINLLHEYLKTLFGVLYRYELLVRECGIEPDWELEFAYVYPLNKVLKTRWVDDAIVIE